jgi:hypothetical protein
VKRKFVIAALLLLFYCVQGPSLGYLALVHTNEPSFALLEVSLKGADKQINTNYKHFQYLCGQPMPFLVLSRDVSHHSSFHSSLSLRALSAQ